MKTLLEMFNRSIEIVLEYHAGQFDKGGYAYEGHPIAVMLKLDTLEEKIVGLLHDTVEDTKLTLADLVDEGFTGKIIAAIEAITKRPEEHYTHYLERVKGNRLATKVKLKDIEHNTEPTRLSYLGDGTIVRLIRKYARALVYLEDEDE